MPTWPTALLAGAAVLVALAVALAVAGSTDRAADGILRAAPGGDGDSWRDTTGQEHRLGLVNTPEHDECFGPEATAERRRLTAGGFRADAYATDRHGRAVSLVTLPDGRVLNVHLARQGFADDRYLDEFRSEHPELAAELEVSFAEARREGRGLWGVCR